MVGAELSGNIGGARSQHGCFLSLYSTIKCRHLSVGVYSTPPERRKNEYHFFYRYSVAVDDDITKNENESTVRTQKVVTLFTFGNEVMIFLKNSRILRSRITK